VESRFESEDSRTHHYLASQTAIPLRQILQDNILTPHLSTVISLPNSGLDNMIDGDRIEDLSRLFRLFTTVPAGLPCLKRSLKDSIAQRGKEINRISLGIDGGDAVVEPSEGKGKGKARPPAGSQTLLSGLKWVQDVLDLKDKFDSVWIRAFKTNREIESAINEA
jgi:cullin 3